MILATLIPIRSALTPLTAAMCCVCIESRAPAEASGSFQGIGPGSSAVDVSGDGQVVVGNAGGSAILWTIAEGIVSLGTLEGGASTSAVGASFSGNVIVGEANSFPGVEAFRWTSATGMVGLGSFVDPPLSFGKGVSADGAVVVGYSQTIEPEAPNHAFRWTSGTGMVDLGPCNVSSSAIAEAVSGDGTIIAGFCNSIVGDQAFRWTGADGFVGLGFLPGLVHSIALGISADGQVVVGSSTGGSTIEAFRWSVGTGMVGLGDLPGGLFRSKAFDASADGAIIVGQAHSGLFEAFIWDEANGMRSLKAVLTDLGLNLNGWTLFQGGGISDDGLTIVGFGLNPSGQAEGWIATLPCNFFTNVAGSCEDPDTDGDGLLDDWEMNGIPYTDANDVEQRYILDFDSDGTNDADPNHKDLFIEVDSMVGLPANINALITVADAFAAVPNTLLGNPDGQPGVRFHIDSDEVNIPLGLWTNDDTNGDGDPDWPTEFDALKLTAASGTTLSGYFGTASERNGPDAEAIREAKRQAYRYCIFGHSLDGGSASGISERPGNDFAVTLGNWGTSGGTPDQQAGTFMHELGHSLGLKHGGGDQDVYKPNYYSVMNYTWQTPTAWMSPASWPLSPGRFGYSTFALLPLEESDLFECQGVSAPPGAFNNIVVPHGTTNNGMSVVVNSFMCCAVDWNRDGNVDCFPDEVSVDLNYLDLGDAPSPGGTLNGFADWPALQYNFRDATSFADGVHVPEDGVEELELTFEVQTALEKVLPPFCVGDLGGDRVVDGADLGQLLLDWDQISSPADLDADGLVDGADLGALLLAWGQCPR